MAISYGTYTITDEMDGSQFWATTTAPTTPNYTFTISDLTGDGNTEIKVGDIIFHDVYRYTVTEVGTTTVKADNRQSLQGETGIAGKMLYGTCPDTAIGTAAKVVACTDATELYAGLAITIKFTNGNTASAPTLNVNGLGAKNIYFGGANASSSNLFIFAANSEIQFVYNGTAFVPIGHPCTYYGTCTVAAGTAAKTSTIAQAVICKGTVVNLQMTYANTVASPTLNVSSTGAKAIYANGSRPTADSPYNWVASSTVSFTFDGQYWRLGDTSSLNKVDTVNTLATEAKATAESKITTFYAASTATPTATTVGDLWIKTDDNNSLWRWNGTSWESVDNANIQTALTNAATAQSTADGKIVTYAQDEEPLTGSLGDLWIDTDDNNKLYRHNGTIWIEVAPEILIGGRNLIIGTLYPDARGGGIYRPHLPEQLTNTAGRGTCTVAEHGLKFTCTSANWQYIYFGASSSAATPDMLGLEAGETYTLSADLSWNILSSDTGKADTTTYYMGGMLSYSNADKPTTWVSATSFDPFPITQADKGTDMSGRLEFTFTVPSDAIRLYLGIRSNNTTKSHYAAGDYIEARNMKLEKGNIATGWTPAPEDLETSITAAQNTATTALESANGKNQVFYQAEAPTGGTYKSGDTWFKMGTTLEDATKTGDIVTFDGSGSVKSIMVNIDPIQSGTGDPSPSNIRPITGHDSVTVKQTGKNLLPYPPLYGTTTLDEVTYTSNSDGTILVNGTATGTRDYTIFDSTGSPLFPNGTVNDGFKGSFIFTDEASTVGVCRLGIRIRNTETGTSRYGFATDGTISVTTGEKEVINRVYITKANGAIINNFLFKPMMRLASEVDDTFVKGTANTYPVSFSSAGIVYGGTVDVMSGVLTVDRANVDLGTLSWDTTTVSGVQVFRSSGINSTVADSPEPLFDCYKSESTLSSLTQNNGSAMARSTYWSSTNTRMVIHDERYTTAADLKTALSGHFVCYKLATPQTYQLTPAEIALLTGTNVMWADTGNISVTGTIKESEAAVEVYQWDETNNQWELTPYGSEVFASIDAGKITTGQLSTILIKSNNNDYWNLSGVDIVEDGNTYKANTLQTNHLIAEDDVYVDGGAGSYLNIAMHQDASEYAYEYNANFEISNTGIEINSDYNGFVKHTSFPVSNDNVVLTSYTDTLSMRLQIDNISFHKFDTNGHDIDQLYVGASQLSGETNPTISNYWFDFNANDNRICLGYWHDTSYVADSTKTRIFLNNNEITPISEAYPITSGHHGACAVRDESGMAKYISLGVSASGKVLYVYGSDNKNSLSYIGRVALI